MTRFLVFSPLTFRTNQHLQNQQCPCHILCFNKSILGVLRGGHIKNTYTIFWYSKHFFWICIAMPGHSEKNIPWNWWWSTTTTVQNNKLCRSFEKRGSPDPMPPFCGEEKLLSFLLSMKLHPKPHASEMVGKPSWKPKAVLEVSQVVSWSWYFLG